MDLGLVIALNMMAVSAIAGGGALLYRPSGWRGWLLAHAAVVLSGAFVLAIAPDLVGWIVSSVFVPLVALPLWLIALAQRAALRGRHDHAERLFRLAQWFQIGGETRFRGRLAAAMREQDPVAKAAALTALRREASSGLRAELDVVIANEASDWHGVLAAARASDVPADLRVVEMRALGELGRLDEMAACYEQIKTRLLGAHHASAQLFLYAFAGRSTNVEALIAGPLADLPVEGKIYWRAVARRAADPMDPAAITMLEEIAQRSPQVRTQRAAAQQLTERAVRPLSAAGRAIVDAAAARAFRERALRSVPVTRLLVTPLLMAANVGMLVWAHVQGGAENLDVLFKLGALWPPAVAQKSEWWRILAASFLHLGPVHLAVNLFMLFLLGRIVESRFGVVWTAGIYLWCAVGSMTAVYLLMTRGIIETNLLVGASGAIFGLVGVVTALDIATWVRSRDRLDLSRLVQVVGILALQTMIDFILPNVSFAAHACGLLVGLVAGGLLMIARRTEAST